MVIDYDCPFEANLKAIAHYLDNLSVVDGSISITPEVKKIEYTSWFMMKACPAAQSTGSVSSPTCKCGRAS